MNDYYNYLNGFTDMNYMTNPNNMIGDLNYQSLMPNMQAGKGEMASVLDSYEGFKRGNMFGNLYDPYKNYKPQKLSANKLIFNFKSDSGILNYLNGKIIEL